MFINIHIYFNMNILIMKDIFVFYNKLFIKNPIIRINTVFFKEIAIKNRSFYHEFTTFERALI